MKKEKTSPLAEFEISVGFFDEYVDINMKGKTVFVVQNMMIAVQLAEHNKVVYVTSDVEKYNFFKRRVIGSILFGNDDRAFLVGQNGVKDYSKELKEILESLVNKEGNIMKFDYCIGNPPYGNTKKGIPALLSFNIFEQIKNYSKNVIWLCPSKFMYSTSEKLNKYIDIFNKDLTNYEIISNTNKMFGTLMPNVVILSFIENAIPIKKIPKKKDFSNKIEKEILNALSSTKHTLNDIRKPYGLSPKVNENDAKIFISKIMNNLDTKFYLNVSLANGSGEISWFSNKLKAIPVMEKNKEFDFLLHDYHCKSLIGNDNKIFLENLKNLMQTNLFKFALYVMQDDQCMKVRVYKYMPLLDYENLKTVNDVYNALGVSKSDANKFEKYLSTFSFNKKDK